MTLDLKMTLPSLRNIDIDDFNGSSINNYDDVRGQSISSNKVTLRTASMSLSEVLVDYATRLKCLNNLPDDEEIREPIDSS